MFDALSGMSRGRVHQSAAVERVIVHLHEITVTPVVRNVAIPEMYDSLVSFYEQDTLSHP